VLLHTQFSKRIDHIKEMYDFGFGETLYSATAPIKREMYTSELAHIRQSQRHVFLLYGQFAH